MIEFGNTLKAAREAKGLTIQELAAQTHMLSSSIEDLEKENFTHLPAPIYGRGFIKLYCEAVGLDPKPLIAEFMDIINGNRETTIRERPLTEPVASEPPPIENPLPPPMDKPMPPPVECSVSVREPQSDPFPTSEPVAVREPVRQPVCASEPPPPPPQASMPPPRAKPNFARYATPIREAFDEHSGSIFALGRISVLAIVAFAILALLVFGVRALYRATTVIGQEAKDEKPAQVLKTVPIAPKAPIRRTPQSVPPLYID